MPEAPQPAKILCFPFLPPGAVGPGRFLSALCLWSLLSGCYGMHVVEMGPGEAEISRRPGPAQVDLVTAPSVDRPVAVLRVSQRPRLQVRRGSRAAVVLEKRPHAMVAFGVGLQWWTTLIAIRDGGTGAAAAIGVNLLSVATLMTRGARGGYLGWLLPDTLRHTYLRHARLEERAAPGAEPLGRVEISLASSFGRWSQRTDSKGRVAVHLIDDLGLARFTADEPVLVSVRTLGQDRDVFVLRPRDFLYEHYRFAAGARIDSGEGEGITTRRERILPLLRDDGGGRYRVLLAHGAPATLSTTTVPAFAYYAGAGAPAEAAARPAALQLLSPRWSGPQGRDRLRRGETGYLRFDLRNSGSRRLTGLRLRAAPLAEILEITGDADLGSLRAGARRQVSISIRCRLRAAVGTGALRLVVVAGDGTAAHSDLRVEVLP